MHVELVDGHLAAEGLREPVGFDHVHVPAPFRSSDRSLTANHDTEKAFSNSLRNR